jgi:hypothetical protein
VTPIKPAGFLHGEISEQWRGLEPLADNPYTTASVNGNCPAQEVRRDRHARDETSRQGP